MSELRKKLKEQAVEMLDARIDLAQVALGEVITETSISVVEMAQLIAHTRTDTLRKRLVNRIVSHLENELLANFNVQKDLTFGTKNEEKL